MSSNKTLKNAQPRSPRPASRNRVRDMALRGIPLQSISSTANRPQSRNNRLLTNVQEIKDNCSFFRDKLGKMEHMLELKEYPHVEELKSEIDALKSVIEKCNEEKKEKDKIIKKLNKELESCNSEKEEIITKNKAKYEEYYKKDKEYYTKIKQQLLEKCKKENEDNKKLLDEYHASNKLLKSKIKELEKKSMNMPATSEELENKVTNYKELYLLAQEEVDALKKRDEIRTMLLTEDYEQLTKGLGRTKDYTQETAGSRGLGYEAIMPLENIIDRVRRTLEGLTPKEYYIFKQLDNIQEGYLIGKFFSHYNPHRGKPNLEGILKGLTKEEFIKNLYKQEPGINLYGNIEIDGITRPMTREEYIEKLNDLWEFGYYRKTHNPGRLQPHHINKIKDNNDYKSTIYISLRGLSSGSVR